MNFGPNCRLQDLHVQNPLVGSGILGDTDSYPILFTVDFNQKGVKNSQEITLYHISGPHKESETLPSFKLKFFLGFITSCYVIFSLFMAQAMDIFMIT